MKKNKLNKEYGLLVEILSDQILDLMQKNINTNEKYSIQNIMLNSLTACLVRIFYVSIPTEMREEAIEILSNQLRDNFIANDKANETKNER